MPIFQRYEISFEKDSFLTELNIFHNNVMVASSVLGRHCCTNMPTLLPS